MRRQRPREDSGPGAVNLTPLLDVIFILIFFFLIATQVRERERFLEMDLPSSEAASEQALDEAIPEIAIAPGGGLLLDGQPIEEDALEAELSRRVREDGLRRAVLASSGDEPFQRIVDLSDLCRRAGLVELTPRMRPPSP